MKVLIVKLSAFGDIIHALPALQDILDQKQVSEVHWLVDQRYGFVTNILPSNVIVHQVALKGDHPVRSAWQAIKALRKIGFDAVIDLQGLIKSAVLARACGSPVYAFDPHFLREKASMILTRNIRFHPQDKHVVQQYRRIAAAPFASSFIAFLAPSSDTPSEAIPYRAPQIDIAHSHCRADTTLLQRLDLKAHSYVILHAAGGWKTKQLPEQSWIDIARSLYGQGITPLFSWGNETEQTQAQNLAAQSNGYALPERLNMSALVALIQAAKAVVGADTGLLHLAAALNQTTITFWGPSASWNSAPFTVEQTATEQQNPTKVVKHWHIESSPACGPCFKRTCNQFVCMDAIKPESITRILHEL
ncbi:MAG: lipopolysaccharide heptosyltransferase I [Mariprofundus sp.]|nr:lipopolysaccharide heptosyltransferase I [Mariprofundus sp.]